MGLYILMRIELCCKSELQRIHMWLPFPQDNLEEQSGIIINPCEILYERTLKAQNGLLKRPLRTSQQPTSPIMDATHSGFLKDI